jgi:FkbM family methyltransferase
MSEHFIGVPKPIAWVWKILNRIRRKPEFFLPKVRGIIHIGANEGQERAEYAAHRLNVVWIEPIPEVFARLEENLKDYPQQTALNELIADEDGKEYQFNVASNNGASSSILEMGGHTELYPKITYTRTLALKGITLPTLMRREGWTPESHDALVLDTQGSELSILKAAGDALRHFRFVATEVADFRAYQGCCTLAEVDEFMTRHGFRRVASMRFASKPGLGSYFNVTYGRIA